MLYRVVTKIVSGNIDNGVPVDVQFYHGDNLASAIAAMGQAATSYLYAPEREAEVPETARVYTLDVHLEFEADCPWRVMTMDARPFWAKHECSGREVETEVGVLCAAHHTSMRNAASLINDTLSLYPIKGASASTEPCPVDGCTLALTDANGLAPGLVCPNHGHPEVEVRPYKLGDPDPTPDKGPWCNHWACTRAANHADSLPTTDHIAGGGGVIRGLYPNEGASASTVPSYEDTNERILTAVSQWSDEEFVLAFGFERGV